MRFPLIMWSAPTNITLQPWKKMRTRVHHFPENIPAKEVSYDKDKQEITNIPSLFFNASQKKFTLRLNEKHVSTLKSLTPKRLTEKNKKTKELVDNESDISGNSNL